MTGSKIVEVNNNNNNAKSRSPTGDKFTSRMTRRKQSATWKDRFITIQLFSKQTLQINIQPKARYSEVLEQICSQLGLAEVNIYGLCVKTDLGECRFLEGSSKVCKRLIDNSAQSEKDSTAESLLHLRVQYYVEANHSFKTDNDRKFYFQQLKENFLKYGFNYPDDRCFLLASYAIHADQVKGTEFDPREYFPCWILKRYGTQFVRQHMPTIAPEHLTPYQALNIYIKELSTPSPYAYNMRLYKLQSHKTKGSNDTRLGIYPHGLDIYEVNNEGYLSFLSACEWSDITAINANKRRLEILANGRLITFYTSHESWCAVISHCLKCAQGFYYGGHEEESVLSNSSSLDEISFRESYIYSDEFDLEWEYEQSILGTLPGHKAKAIKTGTDSHNRNRFSITSTSTMTSGIVSDRTCLSIENSQEDLLQSSECGTRQTSCDSLMEGSYYTKGRTATVQRAISEPSKKFEQLRLQVRRQPEYNRRAVSDETVDEHDYENVSVIRKMLEIQMAANRRRTQSAASQQMTTKSPIISGRSSPIYPNQHTSHPNSSPRKLSVSSSNKLNAVSPLNRYSLISTSPSMEQLLIDYTPPPSYNETHARQRELLLAASNSSNESQTSLPAATPKVTSHSASNSLTASEPQPWFKKRQTSMPNGDEEVTPVPNSNIKTKACSCLKLSHPEIDKLRTEVKDLVSLPMISALCNDKELQRSANICTCSSTEQEVPSSPRPISWHCEMPQAFSFPTSTALPRQACH